MPHHRQPISDPTNNPLWPPSPRHARPAEMPGTASHKSRMPTPSGRRVAAGARGPIGWGRRQNAVSSALSYPTASASARVGRLSLPAVRMLAAAICAGHSATRLAPPQMNADPAGCCHAQAHSLLLYLSGGLLSPGLVHLSPRAPLKARSCPPILILAPELFISTPAHAASMTTPTREPRR
ncbi:hypothetical protein WOLCODRAFT_161296 [Wolfiporia cocos MD-104 SS10]|uniref:Uncharacterized protein n=1 Tax=Wolfiporia cocos (strain MD-104) TaxID=742152 RepID=A0A2H3J752_WOLCO|nr:hypothetical protein WOLCODRAFT_161296 [Wolfiporia cocos MD-104 SS10]